MSNMKKLFSLIVALVATISLWAGSTITYTATKKLDGLDYDRFKDCGSVESHTFSDGVGTIIFSGDITGIHSEAFRERSVLTSITLPNSITGIGDNAFYKCINLSSVKLPDALKGIGRQAFAGCTNLSSITLPNSLETIYGSAFTACPNLTTITIPSSVTYIGEHAFAGCTGLTTATINSTYVGALMFGACTSLTKVTLGNNITSIESEAFRECSSLVYVSVPESLTTIGSMAFYQCSALKSFYIPENCTEIGINAFSGCTNLRMVVNASSLPITRGDKGYGYVAYYATDVYSGKVINGCAITDNGTTLVKYLDIEHFVTIPNGVTKIEEYALAYCKDLTYVSMPNSVTSIGYYAFWGCSSLNSITIPNSVISIGDGAYKGCTSLAIVSMSSYVKSIGMEAFAECINLGSISLPNTVTSMGERAFDGCKKLREVTLSSSLSAIKESTFAGCSQLKSITIPKAVSNIGNTAFDGCSALESIFCEAVTPPTCGSNCFRNVDKYIPVYVPAGSIAAYKAASTWKDFYNILDVSTASSVITYKAQNKLNEVTSIMTGGLHTQAFVDIPIESHTFAGSLRQGTITFAGSLTTIGNYAFIRCGAVTSFTIPASVTTIGESAFASCTGMSTFTFPKNVTSIGKSAFDNCVSLTSITCEAFTPPTCGSNCFNQVKKTIPLYVPKGSLAAYQAADGWKDFTNIQELPLNNTILYEAGAKLPEVTSNYASGIHTNAFDVTIESHTFSNGVGIITFEDNLLSIDDWAFDGCTELSAIMLPASVISIGDAIFRYCPNLSSIVVEAENTVYDSREDCNAIIETAANTLIAGCKSTIVPSTVVNIGGRAFQQCAGLTSITLPESVTSIGEYAFGECTALASVSFGDALTSIGEYAFQQCAALESLIFPETLTSIADYAFDRCTGISTITCFATTPPTCGEDCFYEVDKTIPLYVPTQTSAEAYKEANEWKLFTNIQAMQTDGITNVNANANVSKRIVNGQLLIQREGRIYNAQGAQVK